MSDVPQESPAPSAADPAATTQGSEAQAPAPAPATASGAETAAPEPAIETVVVTARRSAENVQKVPVAINAFSEKDLQREQINTGQDLAGRVPSLVMSPNGGQSRNTEAPTIRGQGATFGASPGVVIYYSEVPLPSDTFGNGQGGPGKFFDLANLQVLKGSQGTLFGRNTTGGALLLEPHKPDSQFEAYTRGESSNFNGKGVEGVLNVPLVSDELSLRVGAKFFNRDGFTTDVATGKQYDSKGYRTFRLGLMWKPADGIQNYLLGYYTHSADTGTAYVVNAINTDGLNLLLYSQAYSAAPPGLLPPPSQQVANQFKLGCVLLNVSLKEPLFKGSCGQNMIAAQQARGVRLVQLDGDPDDILDTGAVIDTFSYQLSDDLTLRNIGSYSSYKHHFRWDTDGSQLALQNLDDPDNLNTSDSGSYTEELQLQGKVLDQKLKFVTGAFYSAQLPEGPLVNRGQALIISSIDQTYSVSQHSYGPYVQGTYNFGGLSDALDGLNLTVGARYSFDDISGSSQLITSALGTTTSPPEHSAQIKNNAPTYTAGVDYKVPTTLLYGKVSRGYKSGGYSPIAVNPDHYTFKPEYVMNYEVGHKSDFRVGNSPVRINSAVYYTDYTDIQRTADDAYQVPGGSGLSAVQFGGATFNAGKATIMGFETDLTTQPLDGLTLLANYSFTYAKYNQYELTSAAPLPKVDCTGQPVPDGQPVHLECVPFQLTPKHQYSVSARYRLPFGEEVGAVEASTTYSWTDRRYASANSVPSEAPGAWLESFGLLNASVSWRDIYGSAFDVQIFGTNLTDRTYRLTTSDSWTTQFFQSAVYGEPRIFGASLGYHWGS